MTAHLSTLRGARLSIAATATSAAVQAVTLLFLANVLQQYRYGLVIASLALIKPVQALLQIGLEQAIVLHGDLTRKMTASLFWGCLCISGLACAAIILTLLMFAGFGSFGRTTMLLSLLLPLSAPAIVARALMRRDFRFGGIAMAEILSSPFGFAGIGIACVELGLGATSLVFGYLAQAAIRSLIYCARTPDFPPRWHLDFRDIKPVVVFATNLAKVSASEAIYAQLPNAFIATFLGLTALGRFSQGVLISSLPVQFMAMPICTVFSTNFRLLRNDTAGLQRACGTLLEDVAATSLPICFGIGAGGSPLILALLGPHWRSTSGELPWLALAAAFVCLALPLAVLNESLGLLAAKLRIQLLTFLALAALLLLWGISGPIHCSQALAAATAFYAFQQMRLSRKGVGLGLRTILHRVLPGLECAVLVGILVGALRFLRWETQPAYLVFLMVATGATASFAFYRLFHPALLRRIVNLVAAGEIGSRSPA